MLLLLLGLLGLLLFLERDFPDDKDKDKGKISYLEIFYIQINMKWMNQTETICDRQIRLFNFS